MTPTRSTSAGRTSVWFASKRTAGSRDAVLRGSMTDTRLLVAGRWVTSGLLIIGGLGLWDEVTEKLRGVARDDRVRRHVARHDAARPDDGVRADGHVRQDRRARPYRCAGLHDRPLDLPVL